MLKKMTNVFRIQNVNPSNKKNVCLIKVEVDV